jgi:saccharopine dehydrogenase-like NADP-dependent oxidoreductase
MVYHKGERDFVVMRHKFTIETPENKEYVIKSTMLACGDETGKEDGFSVMAKTVGYTTAIGVKLILAGKIKETGVQSPMSKEWYEPILKELAENGIEVTEKR